MATGAIACVAGGELTLAASDCPIGGAVHEQSARVYLPAIAGVPRDVYAPWWPYHELRRSSRPHLEFRPTDNCNNGRAIRTIKSVDNAFYLV